MNVYLIHVPHLLLSECWKYVKNIRNVTAQAIMLFDYHVASHSQ